MPTTTIRERVRTSRALLADYSNALYPFVKNVFIFAHRYVAGSDYTAGNNVAIEIDGAQEILFAEVKQSINGTLTDINITLTQLGSGRQGLVLTTADTSASSQSLHIFVICKV